MGNWGCSYYNCTYIFAGNRKNTLRHSQPWRERERENKWKLQKLHCPFSTPSFVSPGPWEFLTFASCKWRVGSLSKESNVCHGWIQPRRRVWWSKFSLKFTCIILHEMMMMMMMRIQVILCKIHFNQVTLWLWLEGHSDDQVTRSIHSFTWGHLVSLSLSLSLSFFLSLSLSLSWTYCKLQLSNLTLSLVSQ